MNSSLFNEILVCSTLSQMHHEFSVRENELGPNVYSGTERHMANIIVGHFKCCLLRYLRGILGANSNSGFSVRKKCVIVLSSLTHQFWVSHADSQSVSPASLTDSAAALPPLWCSPWVPCDAPSAAALRNHHAAGHTCTPESHRACTQAAIPLTQPQLPKG